MSYLHDFPHSTNYDGDLGWLIREYKRLGGAVDDLQTRVSTLEDLYKSIPDEIKKATDAMQAQVNAAIAQMEAKVNASIASINDRMAVLENQMDMFVLQFNEMVAELNRLYREIHNYVDNQTEYMKNWVKAYLEKWAQTYPWLICPVDSRLEPLQEILFHLYNDLSWGIQAAEFDALNLTAQQLDDMNLEARRLDKWGRIVFMGRKFCYMFSPFTGEYVPISEVVLGLARLHQNAVTAAEFDNADLDVEMFDEKAVTAYDFDWTSVWFDEISGG